MSLYLIFFCGAIIVKTTVNCVWADYDHKNVIPATTTLPTILSTTMEEEGTFFYDFEWKIYDLIWPLIFILLIMTIIFFYWMTRMIMECYQRFQVNDFNQYNYF